VSLPVGRAYRSLVLADGAVALREQAVTPRGEDPKLVLAPRVVGVCRSDLKEIAGKRSVRSDFGHELVADVIASDPPELLAGARVCLDPHRTVTRTSGFGELIEISGAAEELTAALPVLPPELPDDVGVFVEPLACALHGVRRWTGEPDARPKGARVAVVGGGMAGFLIAQGVMAAGSRVTVVNRSPGRLRELAARDLLPTTALRTLDERTDERFDAVFIATSMLTAEGWGWATAHVAAGGAIVLYAGTHPGMDTVPGLDVDAVRRGQRRVPIPGADASLLGTHGATPEDFAASIALLADPDAGVAPRLERLVTARITLEEAARRLVEYVRAAPFGKTVVTFGGDPRSAALAA